ncbi:MAG: DEAD/DEAH box helicase [bacterium]|nr:DEAD/DEAH box helicase [bacterium]
MNPEALSASAEDADVNAPAPDAVTPNHVTPPPASEADPIPPSEDETAEDHSTTTPIAEADPFAGVPETVLPALQRRGFEGLTPVQRAVLDADDGKRDLRISSQTGSGKTVALGLTLADTLDRPDRVGPTTLVIAPTRELAMQVRTELEWLFADLSNARCEVVTGGTSVLAERSRLRRRPAVLVGTPGRLLDHLREGALDLSSVQQLVLDEADQMLDLGFKDELDGILEHLPAERRTHLVSATFPRAVQQLADRFQRDALLIEGTSPTDAHADIEHIAYRIGNREHYGALVNLLIMADDERTLVFVRTREDTVTLADKLHGDGFAALPLNGDLAQRQRTRTLDAFKRGTIKTLIATDVAARGLDIESVTRVIHVHLPIDGATYVHRSGRTGRAGKTGRSLLFVTRPLAARAHRLIRDAGIETDWQNVPGRNEVFAHKLGSTTKAADEAIETGPVPHPNLVKAAQQLLENREPADVVAALLRQKMATTRAPFDLTGPGTKSLGTKMPGPTRSRPPMHDYRDAPGRGRDSEGDQPHHESGYTRFRINWGYKNGADPRRILAHICRRGGIDSKMVGSIDMQLHATTFLVGDHVAESFGHRVKKRDSRDPHLFITPADGPHSDGGPRRAGPGGRPGFGPPRKGPFRGGKKPPFKHGPKRR